MPNVWREIPGQTRAIGIDAPIIVGNGYAIVPILKSISKADKPDHYRVYFEPTGYIGQAPTPRAAKDLVVRHQEKTSRDHI